MKRLALHVLLCLLTFSAGVGIEQLWNNESPGVPAPAQAIHSQPVSPYFFTTPPIPSVETLPPVPLAAPTPNLILDFDYEEFDPSGYYSIVGRKPKGFRDLEGFDLSVYSQERDKLVGHIGGLSDKVDGRFESFPFAYGLVTQRRMSFATAIVSEDETEYRFDGEFLRGRIVSDAPAGQAVLKGTLTKSKKGRKIAEAVVKFAIEIHGC